MKPPAKADLLKARRHALAPPRRNNANGPGASGVPRRRPVGALGGPVESCAILTTEANELVRPVHDRMPVILPERHWAAWLDTGLQGPAELVQMLRPYPVGALVNSPRNDGPACLEQAT